MVREDDAEEASLLLPSIGSRIALGKWRGTIRFAGQVASTNGNWLGIEWDDAEKGKHDGVHNGKRYFSCQRGVNSGSFIRPNAAGLSFGSSYLQAVKEKYIGKDEATSSDGASQQHYSRKTLADVEIDVPNLEMIKKKNAMLDKLKMIGLGGWKDDQGEEEILVAKAFDSKAGEKQGDIFSTTPLVSSLDLSRSLLSNWKEVERIAKELPQLTFLSLHFNRFDDFTIRDDSFRRLEELQIDATLMTWREVKMIARRMPRLERLQMGCNGIVRLVDDDDDEERQVAMPNLLSINLAENCLNDWNDVVQGLSQACPRIKTLILSQNQLTSISPQRASSMSTKLESVEKLSLIGNALQNWNDLESLVEWLPKVKDLSIGEEGNYQFLQSIPKEERRLLVIARLDFLESLNHAIISLFERKDAELFYLSRLEREIDKMTAEEVNRWHPNWTRLSRKHGKKNAMESLARPARETLSSRMIQVRIRLCRKEPIKTEPYIESEKSVTIKLLQSAPLRLLQVKIAKELQLPRGKSTIQSIWALLNSEIDSEQVIAQQVKRDLRKDDDFDELSEKNDGKIIFELQNLDWSLSSYNVGAADELAIVVND